MNTENSIKKYYVGVAFDTGGAEKKIIKLFKPKKMIRF